MIVAMNLASRLQTEQHLPAFFDDEEVRRAMGVPTKNAVFNAGNAVWRAAQRKIDEE